jgi:hypothetical protein
MDIGEIRKHCASGGSVFCRYANGRSIRCERSGLPRICLLQSAASGEQNPHAAQQVSSFRLETVARIGGPRNLFQQKCFFFVRALSRPFMVGVCVVLEPTYDCFPALLKLINPLRLRFASL